MNEKLPAVVVVVVESITQFVYVNNPKTQEQASYVCVCMQILDKQTQIDIMAMMSLHVRTCLRTNLLILCCCFVSSKELITCECFEITYIYIIWLTHHHHHRLRDHYVCLLTQRRFRTLKCLEIGIQIVKVKFIELKNKKKSQFIYIKNSL